jgi:hypothetical protein
LQIKKINWNLNKEGKTVVNYFDIILHFYIIYFFNFSIASLLAKFRIDYSDLVVITDLMRKPHEETLAFYDSLIKSYKPKGPNSESM